jgi:large subunit ribosomal protein L4e
MAARPTVSILSADDGSVAGTTSLPGIFLSPIRPDIVRFVHTNVSKNSRQAHGVSLVAGEQTSAQSWGTGRAVSRIPRVRGSGTHRAGQGAFGNMCRGGRMYSPKKTWRRWHRHTNKNQRRYAVASAVAASAVPALVEARGHRIAGLAHVPLVVSDASLANIVKTKDAVRALRTLAAFEDVEKVKASRKISCGRAKSRNRRYSQRKGPLVVYETSSSLNLAVRNLPGIDTCNVTSLNLLQLAPGGQVGRFVIWTESAFNRLESLYGSANTAAAEKKNYFLPRAKISQTDIGRIINSEEVRAHLRAPKKGTPRAARRRNGIKNRQARDTLNPYTKVHARHARQGVAKAQKAQRVAKARAHDAARAASSKAFAERLVAPILRTDSVNM